MSVLQFSPFCSMQMTCVNHGKSLLLYYSIESARAFFFCFCFGALFFRSFIFRHRTKHFLQLFTAGCCCFLCKFKVLHFMGKLWKFHERRRIIDDYWVCECALSRFSHRHSNIVNCMQNQCYVVVMINLKANLGDQSSKKLTQWVIPVARIPLGKRPNWAWKMCMLTASYRLLVKQIYYFFLIWWSSWSAADKRLTLSSHTWRIQLILRVFIAFPH